MVFVYLMWKNTFAVDTFSLLSFIENDMHTIDDVMYSTQMRQQMWNDSTKYEIVQAHTHTHAFGRECAHWASMVTLGFRPYQKISRVCEF